MHVFAAARGRTGEQLFLHTGMLFYLVVGFLAMRPIEWLTPRGAMPLGTALLFIGYLLLPEHSLGGGGIKMRVAWAVFIFGCLTAWSIMRLRPLRRGVGLYVACLLGATLYDVMADVRRASVALKDYVSLLNLLPDGATIVRLRYPVTKTRLQLGFDRMALDPLLHADSLVAVRRKLVDLSDYQAATFTFPVVYRRGLVSDQKRWEIAALEGTGTDGSKSLMGLIEESPVPIHCVVLLGDGSEGRAAELAQTLGAVEKLMLPVGRGSWPPFASAFCRANIEPPP